MLGGCSLGVAIYSYYSDSSKWFAPGERRYQFSPGRAVMGKGPRDGFVESNRIWCADLCLRCHGYRDAGNERGPIGDQIVRTGRF